MGEPTRTNEALLTELETLRRRIRELEALVERDGPDQAAVVEVPAEFDEVFSRAQRHVRHYFSDRKEDPASAHIEFSGERYVLIRAASMSTEFFDLVSFLYRDRGVTAAQEVARGFLYDLAHALGKADAAAFHRRMKLVEPMEKLSAGPVQFAYTGWGVVHLLAESHPSPDESYLLIYDHEDSFEADAWIDRGKVATFPVCVMNAGYSSGWCEQSFDIPLVAAEIECRARGDRRCRFVMAPPSRIQDHLAGLQAPGSTGAVLRSLEVPEFFRRKRQEDDLQFARKELERRVSARTAELEERNAELSDANRRLKELHLAREEFVAAISHELRTPLVTGLGYVKLALEDQGLSGSEAAAGLHVAEKNLKRLAALVENLLTHHTLSRFHDAITPRLAASDIVALCRECIQDLLVRTGRPADGVRLAAPPGPIWAMADEGMIRQVVVNLLDNAHRHAGSDARMTVAVETAGKQVRLSVKDSGRGMPADVRSRATEPYFTTGASKGGIGLGLSIVRRLLEVHGSVFVLESESARGTRASFLLPIAQQRSAREVEAASSQAPERRRALTPSGARILLVDDDTDTIGLIKLLLSRRGCEVRSTTSAEAALELLADVPLPDLVLVDLCLPGMNGIELCRRLKADPRTAIVPVYMFTARAEESSRREASAAGCDGYLIKPMAVDELEAQILAVVSRKA
jgi:signal transduction histidine kinase/ActR/RegA family two-component response regulator